MSGRANEDDAESDLVEAEGVVGEEVHAGIDVVDLLRARVHSELQRNAKHVLLIHKRQDERGKAN